MWAFALIGSVVLGMIPNFLTNDAGWYASLITRDAIILLISMAAYSFIGYNRPIVKLVWALWTGWQAVIFGLKLAEYTVDLPAQSWAAVFSGLTVLFTIWAFTRRSLAFPVMDEPEEDTVYYVFPRPGEWRTLLTALFTHPWGGLAVYINNTYYGFTFNHGFMALTGRAATKALEHAKLVRVRPLKAGDIAFLTNQLGLKWSLKKNCYKVIEPHFGSVSRLLSN